MTPLVLAVTLFLAAPPGDRAGTAEARAAARFSFLASKAQSRASVLERAGEPEVAYDTFVEEGLLDPDIAPPYPGSVKAAAEMARSRGREMVEVEVFEYALEGGLFAMVVFRDGVMAYAVHPSSPSISTSEQVEALYGAGEWRTVERIDHDHRGATDIVVYPTLGIAFAADDEGRLTRKLVWSPR